MTVCVRVFGVVIDRRRLLSVLLLASTLAICALVIVLESPQSAIALGSAVDFVGDFETGDLTGFFWNQNKPEVVSAPHPVRAGKYSARCYLHRYESTYSYRTQIWANNNDDAPEGARDAFQWEIGKEYWLGFSLFIPSDWVDDYSEMTDNILSIQATPDEGEEYRSAILGLRIQEDEWYVISQWAPSPYWPGTAHQGQEKFNLGQMKKGAWNDFVFHIKWSYEDDGLLEVWLDGEEVARREGPNCSNDEQGPRFAIGVYKWGWRPKFDPPLASKTDSRLLYVDELRIAGADASYEDVAPGQSAPAPTATPTSSSTRTTTATSTLTSTPTSNPTVTLTATSSSTSTSTPTNTATSTATPTHTSTVTASPTSTQSPAPSSTSTAEQTFTPTATATSTSSATPTTDPDETVIDDLDPRFTTSFSQDAWQQHIEEGGEHFGASHYYNPQPGSGQDTAVWSFVIERPGRYEVYAWWWEADWRPPDVPYTINHLGGSTTVRVSQRTDGGAWYPLGVFEFQDQGSVVVSDDVSSGHDVVADAIKFVYLGPLPSETATSTPTASPTTTSTATPTPVQDATPTPTATQPAVFGEVVIDDLDDGFSESASQDSWGEYIEAGGRHYGGAHHYNSQVGTGRDTAVWHFTVPRSGFYEVYAWWWEAAWRPPDVPYVVDHLGGRTTVRVDQRSSGGQWNLLGSFYFEDHGSIGVSDDVSSGHDVVADAVRLVYLTQNPPGWDRRLFLPVILQNME